MPPGPGGSRRISAPAGSLAPPTAAAARASHAHSPARAGAAILALVSRAPLPRSPVPRLQQQRRRRRPGRAATSAVTPRLTPPPSPHKPSEGPRGRAALRGDCGPVGCRPEGETRARAPTGRPGMDVPRSRLWLCAGSRSSSGAGFAPVVAVGAWEGASSVSSQPVRCTISPGRPYSFIEFLPLSAELVDRNARQSRCRQNLPKLA